MNKKERKDKNGRFKSNRITTFKTFDRYSWYCIQDALNTKQKLMTFLNN